MAHSLSAAHPHPPVSHPQVALTGAGSILSASRDRTVCLHRAGEAQVCRDKRILPQHFHNSPALPPSCNCTGGVCLLRARHGCHRACSAARCARACVLYHGSSMRMLCVGVIKSQQPTFAFVVRFRPHTTGGGSFFSGTRDGTVREWDMASARCLRKHHINRNVVCRTEAVLLPPPPPQRPKNLLPGHKYEATSKPQCLPPDERGQSPAGMGCRHHARGAELSSAAIHPCEICATGQTPSARAGEVPTASP